MIKEGGYVYVHTLDSEDIRKGMSKGVYKMHGVDEWEGACIYLNHINDDYYICNYQYSKILPNKINKLLYKGLS